MCIGTNKEHHFCIKKVKMVKFLNRFTSISSLKKTIVRIVTDAIQFDYKYDYNYKLHYQLIIMLLLNVDS